MYTNIIHNDDICNYFLKNQQFIFNSLGNCREYRLFAPAPSSISFVPLTRNLSPAAPSLAPSTALGTRNGPRSKARRTADSTDCGQPTARPDAFQRRAVPKAAPTHRTHFQRRAVPKAAPAHRTHLQCAKRPRSLCSLRPLPPFPSSR